MECIHLSFTVLFESPFWVGIYECEWQHHYEVGKVTFGAEPKAGEIYEGILSSCKRLKISSSLSKDASEKKPINPKKIQREIKKQTKERGIGTKAQQALKEQYEQSKTEHKHISKEQREQEKERQFELKKEKRKQKHRGH